MSNINLVNTPASSVSTPVAGKTQLFIDDTGTLSTKNSSGVVTPVGAGLPDQSGHGGQFLTTDGTTASWATVSGGSSNWGNTSGSAFWASNPTTPVNPATVGSSTDTLCIGDTAFADYGADTLVIGHAANAYGNRNVAVGRSAQAGFFGAPDGVAVGYTAVANEASVAVGSSAFTSAHGIAIGKSSNAGNGTAIGIGATAVTSEANIVPGGYFTTAGDVGMGFAQWWMRTTNNTPSELGVGSQGEINSTPIGVMTYADGTMISYLTDIIAKDEAGTNYASWTYQYTMFVESGASTLMGTPTLLSSHSAGSGSGWSVSIAATGTRAAITVTGETGKNIRWLASAKTTRLS